MKKTKIVVLVFALLLGILVVVGIRNRFGNIEEDFVEEINIDETTESCFYYNDTYDGVRVIRYEINNPDAYFVDICKKSLMEDEYFNSFREIYKSDDNYHNFCSNKSTLRTSEEGFYESIKLENVISGLISIGAIETFNYKINEKFYTISDVNKCVTFLENAGLPKSELFDYCSGKNTSMGNLYEDNRSYMYTFVKDNVYNLIYGKLLTENDKKMVYINSYDLNCGDVINIPNTIDGKEVYGIHSGFDGARILLLPNSLKRIDRIAGLKAKNLTLPKGVIYIESESFTESEIENLYINGNPIISASAFNNKIKKVNYNGTCEDINRYKVGFNNYNEIEFRDKKKGKCIINEE